METKCKRSVLKSRRPFHCSNCRFPKVSFVLLLFFLYASDLYSRQGEFAKFYKLFCIFIFPSNLRENIHTIFKICFFKFFKFYFGLIELQFVLCSFAFMPLSFNAIENFLISFCDRYHSIYNIFLSFFIKFFFFFLFINFYSKIFGY